jgi:hypothetical protein
VKPELVAGFLLQVRVRNLDAPVQELTFHPARNWRFDFAWPAHKVALEVEGVVYAKKGTGGQLTGRHVHASGFREDCVKYGEAFRLGWTVLRVLPEQISSGLAADWLAARLTGAPMSPLWSLQQKARTRRGRTQTKPASQVRDFPRPQS